MTQAKQGFNRYVLYSRMPYWGGTPGKVIAEKHILPNGTTEYFIPTYAIGV